MNRTAVLAVWALGTTLASAHHGMTGQFDTTKSVTVTGVVTQMKFVNPHSYVYFNVKNAAGGVDEWRCEMRAAGSLKRSGWTAEMFAPGTQITVMGFQARREPHGCYTDQITIGNGKTLTRTAQLEGADKGIVKRDARRADGKPNLAGNWAAPDRAAAAGAGAAGGMAGGRGAAGGARGGGRGGYEQSDAGLKASAGFNHEDNPRYHCQATNIFADWTFDQHVNRIEQTATTITMKYGFMDLVRTIHLDMAAHPKDITPSRAGHSIGKWDGDTLVVDTVGFAPGYLSGMNGARHSDRLHVVEKFTLGSDGNSLARTWVGEDPLYLKAPFEGRDEIRVSQTEYEPYNCNDLTTERAPGF